MSSPTTFQAVLNDQPISHHCHFETLAQQIYFKHSEIQHLEFFWCLPMLGRTSEHEWNWIYSYSNRSSHSGQGLPELHFHSG